jgi:signal transduction histidine kinase
MFEKRINDKRVDVEGLEDISLILKADEDLMFQVLYNLIENAVKFVNEGGVISFSVMVREEVAHICIKNTGEGLTDDELPKIFDRFYKTDTSRSKDKTGLGLGLSIARNLTNAQNGVFDLVVDGDLFKAIVSFPLVEDTVQAPGQNDAQPEQKTE